MRRVQLRAAVRHPLGTTHAHSDETGAPAAVEIEQNDGGYYLFYLERSGRYLAHTWHETLEDAKARAHLELAVEEPDWATPTS